MAKPRPEIEPASATYPSETNQGPEYRGTGDNEYARTKRDTAHVIERPLPIPNLQMNCGLGNNPLDFCHVVTGS